MEQTPSPELQKLLDVYTNTIRAKIEEKYKNLGIKLQGNIISESINSKDGQDGSGEIPHNK